MKIKQFVNIQKEKIPPEREKNDIFTERRRKLPVKGSEYASQNSYYCKIGEMTIKTYKTNGNKGRMTKYAKKL